MFQTGPLVIGICGGSGCGKTSFINELKRDFSQQDLCIISQDDYYLPREQQEKDQRGIRNFDRPGSINAKELADELSRIIQGETVERLEYTFNNPNVTPKTLIYAPSPVIVVEGLFVFHFQEVARQLSMKIFIRAREDLKVIRRIKRDGLERNYPLDDVLYRYENHVAPTYEKFIKPYIEESDLVINNNENYNAGLMLLKGFLKNHLAEREAKTGMYQL